MKRIVNIYLVLFTFLFFKAEAQVKQEVLTNQTISSLCKKKLGVNIVINKIKTTLNNFDVSTDALIKLKEDSIPDEIVAVMIEYGEKNKVVSLDVNNPLTKHSSGIYYFNPNDSVKPLIKIDPTVVSSGKSGGVGQSLANQYSYGLANIKITSVLSGSNSRRQIRGKQLVFYFYFDKSQNNLNQTASANWWFATASSPNEFALVRLRAKKDSREFDIASANNYGSSVGISEQQKVQYTYDQVSENIYKLVITGDLAVGEYCFIYTGSTPSIYSNDKVFDFGTY